MKPAVSVLIPAYNVEPYVRECLESVLCQTLQDFEIICVDDASTDGTLSVLREYEAKDPRIHVYAHERNLGQGAGRNHALSHASGEYVYMLDADDMLRPQALKELTHACREDRLDVIGFETENFADSEQFEKNAGIRTLSYTDTEVLDGREALTCCMETESFSLSTPTFLMRRAYLTENGIRFTEGILHEDVGYILELLVRAERVRFVHAVYFRRRIRARSTMTRGFTDRNIEGYLKSFYRSFELEPECRAWFENDPAFRRAFRKWQRDIFGRLNQLYEGSAETIGRLDGGHVDEEIRRAFEMVKLSHFRVEKLPFSECYLCGTGAYTVRAVEAVGAQDILIRGIIVTEKSGRAFHGFPLITPEEAEDGIPVILSVSHYKAEEYRDALRGRDKTEIIELDL